jgi:hypothetical protein
MAANKNIRIGPVALTTTLTTNILNPQTLTGGVSAGGTSNTATYILIRHIRIANKTASAATFSLWIGATGSEYGRHRIHGHGAVGSGKLIRGLVRHDSP